MDRAVVVNANLKNAVLQRAVFTRSDLTGAVVEARAGAPAGPPRPANAAAQPEAPRNSAGRSRRRRLILPSPPSSSPASPQHTHALHPPHPPPTRPLSPPGTGRRLHQRAAGQAAAAGAVPLRGRREPGDGRLHPQVPGLRQHAPLPQLDALQPRGCAAGRSSPPRPPAQQPQRLLCGGRPPTTRFV